MSTPDLNLLVTLDVLLAEGSVARAARRLRLSPSAMSRALARLRETTGDPLLVRAGRGLVPTPRALELRERVGQLVQDGEAVLRPAETARPRTARPNVHAAHQRRLRRELRTATSSLASARRRPACGCASCRSRTRTARRFATAPSIWRPASSAKTTGPEVRAQALFRDRFVGVVRMGHPLSRGKITPSRYAAGRHICVSRRGPRQEDRSTKRLEPLGLEREIVTIVGGFSTALALARASDLIASVPERHTGNLRAGMHSFPLPVSTPEFTVSLLWHPRLDADPAHRWLRGCVQRACADPSEGSSPHLSRPR